MNEVVLIKGPESKRILQSAVDKKILTSMCYLSKGKWHMAKILPLRVDDASFAVAVMPAAPPEGIQTFDWKPTHSLKVIEGRSL